jgi:hypothetical protein
MQLRRVLLKYAKIRVQTSLVVYDVETSAASVCSEVFSGDQSSEDGVDNLRLGDCLCHSSHQPLMMEAEIVSETWDGNSIFARLIARQDLITL